MAGASNQFAPNTVFDSLFSFEAGMNAGENALLLQKNELPFASNLTVRGTFAHPRSPRNRYTLDLTLAPTLATQISNRTFLFQGYCFYQPDSGVATLMASISGRLYQFTPNPVTKIATVKDVTGGNPQSATATQCWLWQAEKWVFWNDGINLPVFFDGTTTTRSNGTPVTPAPVITQATFVIPSGYNINSTPPPAPIAVTLTSNFIGANGDAIVVNGGSTFAIPGTIVAGAGTPNITVSLNIVNISPPHDIPIQAGATITDTQNIKVRQFPVGRMGAYGRGRVWMALANSKDFIAGDIVRGPSGTAANDYRDAVLNVTENDYLVGGGLFTVPGSIGEIRAMIFEAELDTSLGQGPLLVLTPTHIFSCQAPVDRLQWQSLTNPILTETIIANGGLGQNSTFLVNSDTYYRAVDGWRSLILAARDFKKWNNTPISHQIDRILAQDNQTLLPWGTGCFFDNRILMSIAPISTANGVYHQGMVVINTDLITTIRGKDNEDMAYDGVWPGQNVMGIINGQFSLVERCFQFVYNTVQTSLELWELLPSNAADVANNPTPVVGDNGTDAIEWWFESPSLQFNESIETRTYKGLVNGEIHVDNLVGRVDFQVFWKPDQYPCWIPWHSWSECARQNTGAASDNTKPQFRPRMGLGTPSKRFCDPSTNRPLSEGYTFQIKVVVTGQCEFIGFRCAAVVLPEPTFAAPACSVIC